MSEERKELIDLNKLSERELLILLNHKVQGLDERVEHMEDGQQEMALKINSMESKSKVWAGIVGFFTGLFALILERLINK